MAVKPQPIVEIYDDDHDETFVIREHLELPGLLTLSYDTDPVQTVSFTPDQAEAVGRALLEIAPKIRAMHPKAN